MPRAYVEADEIKRLEEAAEYLGDRLLIRLLFHLGCRISEALGIRVGDVDFAQGTITIEHLKTRSRLSCPDCRASLGRSHHYCPGCGAKVGRAVTELRDQRRTRTLPVDRDTVAMLREYTGRGGPVERDGRKLICGINRHRAWQIIKECAEKAGLPKLVNPETGKMHNVSPHRLRDAFAVHAIKVDDSGDGLRMLQQHLGHQSITTAMRYRKVAGEEHKEWYERLWQ